MLLLTRAKERANIGTCMVMLRPLVRLTMLNRRACPSKCLLPVSSSRDHITKGQTRKVAKSATLALPPTPGSFRCVRTGRERKVRIIPHQHSAPLFAKSGSLMDPRHAAAAVPGPAGSSAARPGCLPLGKRTAVLVLLPLPHLEVE